MKGRRETRMGRWSGDRSKVDERRKEIGWRKMVGEGGKKRGRKRVRVGRREGRSAEMRGWEEGGKRVGS